jgi:hypothetical protein
LKNIMSVTTCLSISIHQSGVLTVIKKHTQLYVSLVKTKRWFYI